MLTKPQHRPHVRGKNVQFNEMLVKLEAPASLPSNDVIFMFEPATSTLTLTSRTEGFGERIYAPTAPGQGAVTSGGWGRDLGQKLRLL